MSYVVLISDRDMIQFNDHIMYELSVASVL